jgi:Cu(I)/Ag(I) efflux system membrane protein CusA/SilA
MPGIKETVMIEWIIRRSVANRFLVMMGVLFLSVWGGWTIVNTPVDALPDLSDVQVIVKTSYPGQAPQIVENQVTYPLTTTMLSVPGRRPCAASHSLAIPTCTSFLKTGRICTGRDRACWSTSIRCRVNCRRASARDWPDATGVGWIFEYALVDKSGKARSRRAAFVAGLVPEVRAENHP